jgi:hypothetical protein
LLFDGALIIFDIQMFQLRPFGTSLNMTRIEYRGSMMKEYKHTQIGYLLLFIYSAVLLVIGCLSIVTGFHPIALVALILMLIALGLFATLTVAVDDQMIKIQFGLGVIRKGFLLKDIEAYRVVKNPWYYGWGIRYTPRGWLFNVSGLSAIELQMKSGKLYRIGTDDAERLAKALDEALNDSSVH